LWEQEGGMVKNNAIKTVKYDIKQQNTIKMAKKGGGLAVPER